MKIFMVADPNIIPTFYEKTRIKPNIMISYHYLRGAASKVVEKYRHMINLLFLDSGAYTASKENLPITVHEYLGYLKMYGRLFDQVFNLDDKFDDPDHNLKNQLILEEGLAGTDIKPVPVVHDTQDPFEEFKMYAELGHDYIAIGSNKKLKDEVFDKMEKEFPNVKVHMFGTLNRKMLFNHKHLYSADATSYAKVASRGTILYWDPINQKEHKIDAGEREKKGSKVIHFKEFIKHNKNLEPFLQKTFNYNYRDFLISHEAISIVNLFFFTQLENRVNQAK